jgi:PBP1b-binding outer membrane lipoprotein LpoB
MKTKRNVAIICLLLTFCLVITGCGKKADESKPMSEVKAEAEKMSTDDLEAAAKKYMDAAVAKKGEIEKLTAKLKDIPIAQMAGDEAKKIKDEVDAVTKSLSALTERFQVYYDKLKEKGIDVSALKI